MTGKRDKTEVLWNAGDGEHLPGWYKRPRPLRNVVWQHQLDHLVYDHWMRAFRGFYIPENARFRFAHSEHLVDIARRMSIGIQERIHVASSKNRSIAVSGWANISLTEEDKEAILAAEISVETMLQDVGVLVFGGYRFSLTYDAYSKAVQATLVCANEEDGNYQYGLSARHPDPVLALKSLLYKHAMTEDTGWREFVKPRSVDEWG